MLENWAYQPEVLKLISTDPADLSKPMPGELADRLVAARTYDSGIRYTRQNYLASLDQALHTSGGKVDPDAVEHARSRWLAEQGNPSCVRCEEPEDRVDGSGLASPVRPDEGDDGTARHGEGEIANSVHRRAADSDTISFGQPFNRDDWFGHGVSSLLLTFHFQL
jgi:hypothetical protein